MAISIVKRSAILILSIGAAYALTLFTPLFEQTPILLPFATIVISALYLGMGYSFIAIIITLLAQDYFFVGPLVFFDFDIRQFLEAVVFTSVAFCVACLADTLHKTEKKLEYQSFHDHLTGLPNRRLLEYQLSQIIKLSKRKSKQFAVLSLDLNKFKQVNDTLGHDYGDILLKKVGRRLRDHLREEDIIARMGGDEFIIVLPEIRSVVYAHHVSDKIKNATSKPFFIKRKKISVSSSIGIAIYPSDGVKAEDLLKNADTAMYNAKRNGKNRVFNPARAY